MVFLASSRIKAAKDQSLLGDSILLISPIASFSIVTFSQLLVTAILIPSASAHASEESPCLCQFRIQNTLRIRACPSTIKPFSFLATMLIIVASVSDM
ncbi:hypothetical protein V6N11_024207 [Hibiscus sabdariffa]|uniref:Uncharacterized protein n=1 Tax=Hibiscus sabdariffa TaxID=183260 RepID=A0ABR2N7V4_9ROSI